LPFKKCLKEYNFDPLIEKNAEDANSCELANIGLLKRKILPSPKMRNSFSHSGSERYGSPFVAEK
jgi:hypothetical protein